MAGSSFGRVHQARSPACSLPCPSLSPSLLTSCPLLLPSLPPSLLTSCSLPFPSLPPYIGFSPLSLPPSLNPVLSPYPPSLLPACPSRFPSLPPYMHIVGLHKEAVDQLIDIQVGQQVKNSLREGGREEGREGRRREVGGKVRNIERERKWAGRKVGGKNSHILPTLSSNPPSLPLSLASSFPPSSSLPTCML